MSNVSGSLSVTAGTAAALGLVPQERRGDVVYLDLGNHKRPFGVNLLDVGLGWNRDQAVGNALRVFKREFGGTPSEVRHDAIAAEGSSLG